VAPIAAVVVGGAVFLVAGAIQRRVRRQGDG